MNSKYYTYIFFEVPKQLSLESKPDADVSSLFDKWISKYNLKEPENSDWQKIFDQCKLKVFRQAQSEELSICLSRFHDLDILEIEWEQISPDKSPIAFWEESLHHLESMSVSNYFGITHALFTNSENFPKETLKSEKSTEISNLGKFYTFGKNSYVLLAENENAEPAGFLGIHFAIMASAVHKLEFEDNELNKIKKQDIESELEYKKLTSSGNIRDIEKNFDAIRTYLFYLHDNRIRLAEIRQTFDINILNLENLCKIYHFQNDSLFFPLIQKAKNISDQLNYDLIYRDLNLKKMENRLKIQEMEIEKQRLESQKWTDWLIALLIIPIGGAQIVAALGCKWIGVICFMLISTSVIFFAMLRAERKSLILRFLNRIRQESRRLSSYFLTLISYKKKNL